MTDYFIFAVFLLFVYFGLSRPAIAFSGYLWIDIVVPQQKVFGFLAGQSLSMYMAVICILSLVVGQKRLKKSEFLLPIIFFILFAIWITITTQFAHFPFRAEIKWDTTIKTLIMASCLIFAITNRKQLELALLIMLFSFSFYMLSAGLKTLTGGGGYGNTLIVGGGNSGWSESSTLAAFSVICMPLIIFFKKHITLLPHLNKQDKAWYGALICCVATLIGSTARTGLISLAAYFCITMLTPKNLIKGAIAAVICAVAFINFAPPEWTERMNTLNNVEQEGSAMGRVVVWQWTIDYVKEHPFMGGGFDSFLANKGQLSNYSDTFEIEYAKAFHSIYFEVLGEQGYVGFIIYFTLLFWAYRKNASIASKKGIDNWSRALAYQMKLMIFLFCVGGLFVGIAYKPFIFQIVALTVAHASILKREQLI